jgi:hypothetical protein
MTVMETENKPVSVRVAPYLPTALFLMIIGWSGLYWVTNYTEPNGGTRWLFFFMAVVALSGTAIPVIAFLNRRFPSTPLPTGTVITRQAIWVGIYFPIILWLQLGHVANFSLALLLAAGLILIEFLLRLRERSMWKPERRR